jgi:hypothetical protein
MKLLPHASHRSAKNSRHGPALKLENSNPWTPMDREKSRHAPLWDRKRNSRISNTIVQVIKNSNFRISIFGIPYQIPSHFNWSFLLILLYYSSPPIFCALTNDYLPSQNTDCVTTTKTGSFSVKPCKQQFNLLVFLNVVTTWRRTK